MEPEYNEEYIRPYNNEEAHNAFVRVCDEPELKTVLEFIYKDKAEEMRQYFLSIKTIYEFQKNVIARFVMSVADKTADSLTINGLEKHKDGKKYLYTSNHRDIIMDAAFLNTLMLMNDMDTAQNAIGDNLCAKQWITDMMKLNKNFIVKRSGSTRDIYSASVKLSSYIRRQITKGKDSIWLAEREGRAKDSNDTVQESVLKMLSMSSGKNMKQGFMELNITPVSISYEFDGCDYLKAKEFQQKRDNADFKKTKADDILSMKTGILGYKGNVHYEVTDSINEELDKMVSDDDNRATVIAAVQKLIDQHIHKNYRIYPINYVALDERNGNSQFASHYTAADKERFDQYISGQLGKIELDNKDEDYLRGKLLEMYSNPLINHLAATNND
ncbi:MAG: 1-acyl-sn-glycerol-3-phosphate acyltransferase [Paludibacteraceae bacterium]|nr:1-acyl-sn-glycerol-3-phosphate acyltransferase [Paludibacteraceae bacterium]